MFITHSSVVYCIIDEHYKNGSTVIWPKMFTFASRLNCHLPFLNHIFGWCTRKNSSAKQMNHLDDHTCYITEYTSPNSLISSHISKEKVSFKDIYVHSILSLIWAKPFSTTLGRWQIHEINVLFHFLDPVFRTSTSSTPSIRITLSGGLKQHFIEIPPHMQPALLISIIHPRGCRPWCSTSRLKWRYCMTTL